MKTLILFITVLALFGFANGQDISKKLQIAVTSLEADEQLKNGMVGFYVVNQKTGNVVTSKNATIGMPVASAQKIITSIAALELLGANYRYQTTLEYQGLIKNGTLVGDILLKGSGDPTLGSWRYNTTSANVVLNKWISALKRLAISSIEGKIILPNNWESQTIPGGWIWEDIGNYFGAGSTILNWHENQYDLKLRSGINPGDKVNILSVNPNMIGIQLVNELAAGKKGSGDNAYIYLPPYSSTGFIRGTIPAGQSSYTVSGSFPDPLKQTTHILYEELRKNNILIDTSMKLRNAQNPVPSVIIDTHLSPPLDSINYWFLRKSINLYAEAFTKTIGHVKKNNGSALAGLNIIKQFWEERGIEPTAINMFDGSGLSPQNRITSQALVKAMQYARSQPYFNLFYNALPEFNGIKMKSGTIGGVKSFTGYVNGYTFAIVVNNYNGSTASIVKKIYRLLDYLK